VAAAAISEPMTGASWTHGAPPPSDSVEGRVLDAAEVCVARWGVAKTTIDDLAREAGCSRATVYRAFPGGRDVVFDAAANRLVLRFFAHVAGRVAGAATLADAAAVVLSESCAAIAGHPAVAYVLAHEPEVLASHLSFGDLDPLLGWARAFAETHFTRFVDPPAAREVGEWLARIVVSYGFDPRSSLDLADPVVSHRFVSTYLVPGLDPSLPSRYGSGDGTAAWR
jgi:AcrR family transcriptional regulator